MHIDNQQAFRITNLEREIKRIQALHLELHQELLGVIKREARQVWSACAAGVSGNSEATDTGDCIRHVNKMTDAFIERFGIKKDES